MLNLSDIAFTGPALPDSFVRLELEKELKDLLPKTSGEAGRALADSWDAYRRHLRELVSSGGPLRVRNAVIAPLADRLGYSRIEEAPEVTTREGIEHGGGFLAGDAGRLRFWTTALAEDLDAPARRGHAFRFSHLRVAQRVLLAAGERVGLLTNGIELRLLYSDPARTDSQIEIPIESHWKRCRDVPDSYRLLVALASPAGLKALPELVEQARLRQTGVTKDLRRQAREAVECFVQGLLDHPANQAILAAHGDKARLADQLWYEGLINIFRLLFVLKMESVDDPARAFSFASSSLWRNTYSPSVALAPVVRTVLDQHAASGSFLETSLRSLYRMFTDGLACTEMHVKPLGGALFGENATPLLSSLLWNEEAVAKLLDRLLWTPRSRGSDSRDRVHYGSLTVQDLGRVYESLIELSPGLATEPMCRLRRRKLEVVVPLAQGDKYRAGSPASNEGSPEEDQYPSDPSDPSDETDASPRGNTPIEWIEEIPAGRFYLRVGLGRKASGSYYTPDSFVRFLVKETLGPLCDARSPRDDPQPARLLEIKVADIAMGSGHFLFETCDFLADRLYEACRQCDELAMQAEVKIGKSEVRSQKPEVGIRTFACAAPGTETDPNPDPRPQTPEAWRARVQALPDPNDELMAYLPSRAPEDGSVAFSAAKALALCKRLVAVHCLYGVDLNPLAVELAKLSLWIETHAEGLPLTFLDHRFVVGDSLSGPFFDRLHTYPGTQQPMDDLFVTGLKERLAATLQTALREVRDLEATVGASLGELEAKRAAKARLDELLAPLRLLAAAWSGGVMLGPGACDDQAYQELARAVTEGRSIVMPEESRTPNVEHRTLNFKYSEKTTEEMKLAAEETPGWSPDGATFDVQRSMFDVRSYPTLALMIAKGRRAVPFDLTFPDVFFPAADPAHRAGFDTVLGNPPWDAIQFKSKEFFAGYDFRILDAPTKREREAIEERLIADAACGPLFEIYKEEFEEQKRANEALYRHQKIYIDGDLCGRQLDLFRVFMERNAQLIGPTGCTGVVVPSAFHANEGATGIRRLYLNDLSLRCCYSFENRRKLFDIDSRFKFALVIAARPGPTTEFACGFYLHDDAWLYGSRADERVSYLAVFVARTGGPYLSLLELRDRQDVRVVEQCIQHGDLFGTASARLGMRFGNEFHMTNDAACFTPMVKASPAGGDVRTAESSSALLGRGLIVLHEGKTLWQYDDLWGTPPRYAVALKHIVGSGASRCTYLRLAYRAIASSTNERTAVFALLPASVVAGHSVSIELAPNARPLVAALRLLAAGNSFIFDWYLRQIVGANITQYQISAVPIPILQEPADALCAHSALRLTCNHAGYTPLWADQLGDAWREPTPRHTWPLLSGDDARWAVRAAIDAVVADAYGLDRDQYAHILSTFSHKSYPKAPALCLAAFDELKSLGLASFTRKHDPYWDIPLVETLPKPVIELPEVGRTKADVGSETPRAGAHPPTRRPRRPRAKAGEVREHTPDYGPLFGGTQSDRLP